MAKTRIEWTDYSWNPVTGCTPVSSGCDNCYASKMHQRFSKQPFSNVTCHPERLEEPLHWRKPRKIFVCSMGDLFHEEIPEAFIDLIFCISARAIQHAFIVLTKRPNRMLAYISDVKIRRLRTSLIWPRPNIWLGVSCEDQKTADERIPILLQTPAAVRFASIEPLLRGLEIRRWIDPRYACGCGGLCDTKESCRMAYNSRRLDWIIAGCESGPKRRHISIEAFRSLRDQCISANVPFFLKQVEINGKVEKMQQLDGRVWSQFPEVRN